MTVDELKELNLPITADSSTVLYVGAALDWLQANTTLKFDKDNIYSIKLLPDGAKVFICKYFDVMGASANGVVSESIGGMSQTFSTAQKNAMLYQYANELIGSYLKGQVSSVPNVTNWKDGRVAEVKKPSKPSVPTSGILYDDTTGKPYKLGVDNSKLYIDEVQTD